jgi:hypothetical protein
MRGYICHKCCETIYDPIRLSGGTYCLKCLDTEWTWVWKQYDRYANELDKAAEILQRHHPIGEVKAIGRLEVAHALQEVIGNQWSAEHANPDDRG